MLLSDTGIINRIKQGTLKIVDPNGKSVIDPNTGQEAETKQLEPHGCDLRINRVFSWRKGDWVNLNKAEKYKLKPGEMVVVETYERLCLSKDVAATVHSRARMSLLGYSAISTTIHPGWCEGEEPAPLEVAISNIGRGLLELKYKDPLCRLLFYTVEPSANRPAPSLKQVTEMFDFAREHMSERVNRKRMVTGWAILFFALLAATFIIFSLRSVDTLLLAPVATIIGVFLTWILGRLRENFNIF